MGDPKPEDRPGCRARLVERFLWLDLSAGGLPPSVPERVSDDYWIFTSAWDEEVAGGELIKRAPKEDRAAARAAQRAIERVLAEELAGAGAAARPGPHALALISDGAPMDESTVMALDGGILRRRFEAVAAELQAAPDMRLLGVGIEHELSRRSSRSVELRLPGQVETRFVPALEALLSDAVAGNG